GLRAAVSEMKPVNVFASQRDSALGSVQSHARAGIPLTISPTRPVNAACWLEKVRIQSAPARRSWLPTPGPRSILLYRVPTCSKRSDPSRGSISDGTGRSVRRSMITDSTGLRSVDRLRAVTLAKLRSDARPPFNRCSHVAWTWTPAFFSEADGCRKT